MAIVIENLHAFRRAMFAPLAVLACIFLVSCGESNNLSDPKEIVTTSNCKELESDDLVCVPGYFVDDAVQGLNYSCGKVVAVTGVEGSFSCPQDSDVEFSILNPDDASSTAKKIVLGEVKVKSLPTSSSRDSALYITPVDLGAANKTNIVRLLQTLRKQDLIPDESPSRRIVIEDDVKRLLVHLPMSIRPSDFSLSSTDFEAMVQPLVTQLLPARNLITPTAANSFLKKAVHSTVAGSYWVPGASTSIGYKTSDAAAGDYFGSIRGINATNYLLATTWNLVDRKGRMTGFGIYSTGSVSTSVVPDKCKLLVASTSSDCTGTQPSRNLMRLNPDDAYWSNWKDDGTWRLSYTLADSSGAAMPSSVFSFVQGKMDRGAIAGTSYLYKSIFGVNVAENADFLGRWTLSSSSFTSSSGTSATIARLRPVAPTLDPRYWEPDDFPLAFTLGIYEDRNTLIDSLPVAILPDGNIITNFDGRCGQGMDYETLKYPGPGGLTEFPLGTVAQSTRAVNNGVARTYLSLMMIIPDHDDLNLSSDQNRLIGLVDDGQSGVRLRIDNNNGGAGYLKIYKDNAFISNNDGTFSADDQDWSAVWTDNLPFLRGGVGAANSSGLLFSQPQTCPP